MLLFQYNIDDNKFIDFISIIINPNYYLQYNYLNVLVNYKYIYIFFLFLTIIIYTYNTNLLIIN